MPNPASTGEGEKKQTPGKPLLLLEGPRQLWRIRRGGEGGGEGDDGDASARAVDALPYYDKEYEDAGVRAEVNRLVQEEMRRGSKRKPTDYLSDLPPVPPLQPQRCPMFAREYDRVRAGKPPVVGVDTARYELAAPGGSRAADSAAWKSVVQTACALTQHHDVRRMNLELMQQYGSNAWRASNQHLEAFLARLQALAAQHKAEIEAVNRDRKLNQMEAAAELSRLQSEWREGVKKNMEIEAACGKLRGEIDELRRRATALGVVIPEGA